ncbi:MAG: BRO family protein [Burkholderia sp.]
MKEVGRFEFEGHPLRTGQIDGEPWFVAKDVCDALGMNTSSGVTQWIKYLDEDETRGVKQGEFPGLPNRGVAAVSESGLYALIMRSRKPQARAFRKWVTSVVPPAIRKDGSYVMGEEKVATGEMDEGELLARAMIAANNKIERLQTQIAANAQKVEFFNGYVDADGNIRFREFAKMLGCKEPELRSLLAPKYMYRGGSAWLPRAEYRDRGWFNVKAGCSERGVGITHAWFTPRGVAYFTRKFNESVPACRPYLPAA